MIVLAIIVFCLAIVVATLGFKIQRINERWREIAWAFEEYLKADLDCHWKDSAEHLLKVLEKE